MTGTPEQLRRKIKGLVHWSAIAGTTHALSRTASEAASDGREDLWLEGSPPYPATLLLPDGPGPHPAVLYCHAHGGDYDLGRRELTEGAPWLDRPSGPALVAAGFAVLAIDAIGFGARRDDWSESATAKSLLWQGESLFGLMLDDLRDALGYLASRDDIDASHIFTFGVSMGGALAWWLAALDERVAGCAHAVMLADILGLMPGAAHDRHGLYYIVPGLLRLCDQGDIAGLVAPRPQFVAHGARDPLTPRGARNTALERLTQAYGTTSSQLETLLVPEAGHHFTTDMQDAAIRFLVRHATTMERTPP